MFDDRSQKVCLCECHSDKNDGFLEFMPCCEISNDKYIFWTGEVDHSRLATHLKAYQAWKNKERSIYLSHQAQSSKDETKP
jgi:hypothetical protein